MTSWYYATIWATPGGWAGIANTFWPGVSVIERPTRAGLRSALRNDVAAYVDARDITDVEIVFMLELETAPTEEWLRSDAVKVARETPQNLWSWSQ